MQQTEGDDFRALGRRYRERKRWSQERLTAEAAMDHSLVSRLESGQRQPTREAITKLCAGLTLDGGDADRLWLTAGFVPPDLDADELRAALALVRTASAAEVAAATMLIAEARRLVA